MLQSEFEMGLWVGLGLGVDYALHLLFGSRQYYLVRSRGYLDSEYVDSEYLDSDSSPYKTLLHCERLGAAG